MILDGISDPALCDKRRFLLPWGYGAEIRVIWIQERVDVFFFFFRLGSAGGAGTAAEDLGNSLRSAIPHKLEEMK